MSRSWKTNRPGGLDLTRAAAEVCGFAPCDLVLDAGSGACATAIFLQTRGLAAVSLDKDVAALAGAGRTGLGRVGAVLPFLPFGPDTFKGIFCECVLSLVGDKAGCLTAFFEALAPGGYLMVADLVLPQGQTMAGARNLTQPATCLEGAVPLADLVRAIEIAGFDIRVVEDHTALLKQMACEMVFAHGSLDRFWEQLTGSQMAPGLAMRCRTGRLKPGYGMVIGQKHG